MLNGIKNCVFINSSVEDFLKGKKRMSITKYLGGAGFDFVLIDPPRPGLTSECLKGVLDIGSKHIVYISCNPATLARDVRKMLDKYNLESLYMADFFPNTYHIEAIAFLGLK